MPRLRSVLLNTLWTVICAMIALLPVWLLFPYLSNKPDNANQIFTVDFRRYTDRICNSSQLGKPNFLREEQCKSWIGEQPFQSHRHAWIRYGADDLDPSGFGACQIRAWAEDGCKGQDMGRLREANSFLTFGYCFASPHEEHLRSIMVMCNRSVSAI